MSFLDMLKQQRNSKAVALDKFIRMNAQMDDTVFVFVEGATDSAFYDFQIESYNASINYEYIHCANRQGVLQTFNGVKKHALLRGNKTIFIVDKDLHDYISNENLPEQIYRTHTYSFENSLVDAIPLSKLWRNGIYKATVPLDYAVIKRKFTYAWKRFSVYMREFHSQVVIYKREHDCKLQKIKMSAIISFDNDLSLHIDADFMRKLKAKAAMTAPLTSAPSDLVLVSRAMRLANPKSYIRGKFELEFLRIFLEKFHQICKSVDVNFSYRFDNNDVGLTNYLSPRSKAVPSFHNYLAAML